MLRLWSGLRAREEQVPGAVVSKEDLQHSRPDLAFARQFAPRTPPVRLLSPEPQRASHGLTGMHSWEITLAGGAMGEV